MAVCVDLPDIGLAVRVFANGPGDLGSISGRVIPKTQKMVLDASLLNTQHYKVRIKGKVEPSREGVAPSPTSWCSSYRKGSLRVTLDYGRQLYFLLIWERNCKYSAKFNRMARILKTIFFTRWKPLLQVLIKRDVNIWMYRERVLDYITLHLIIKCVSILKTKEKNHFRKFHRFLYLFWFCKY